MPRTWIAGIVGAALVLLAACGGNAEPRGKQERPLPQMEEPSGPLIDWDAPLHGGRSVASVTEAAQYVHFSVRQPRFAGRPALIQVDDPAQVAVDDRTVAFVYHLPAFVPVVVEERSAHLTLTDLRRRAEAPGAPEGAFQMVPVRATQGLLVSANGSGRLLWVEGGVLFDITGPSVNPSQVQSLAALV